VPELTSRKIISHRLSRPAVPVNDGRCQRTAGLSHISGLRLPPDRRGSTTLRGRKARRGVGTIALCTRFDNGRSMPFSLSMGYIPNDQGGGEDPHATRSERLNTHICQSCPWKRSRRNDSRYGALQRKLHCNHGSCLYRLWPSVCDTPSACVFCDPCQAKSSVSSLNVPEGGQDHGSPGRSDHLPDRCTFTNLVPGSRAARIICRSPSWKAFCFPDQRLQLTRTGHCRYLQATMADRALFQVDQATPENQNVLRYVDQCSKNPGMGCYLCLLAGDDHEKAA